MVHYKKNVCIVLDALKQYRYGARALTISEKCYAKLRTSMENSGSMVFSEQTALSWCETEVAKTDRSQYRTAIYRLAGVYKHGRLLGSHLVIYAHPSDGYTEIIDNYISLISSAGCYTNGHLKNIKHACIQFCCFAQYNGFHSVGEISYMVLEQYDTFLRESTKAYYITEGLVAGFLKYLADQGLCPIGYSLFIHYIESDKCTSLKELGEKARFTIENRRGKSLVFSSGEFYRTIPHFTERLVAFGYSKTVTDSAPYHLTLLFLFLDRENLGYDRMITAEWFGCVGKRLFSRGMPMARRTYEMYDDYVREGDVLPDHRWKHRKTSYDLLPSWCRTELGGFIDGKKKEGWDKHTIDIYQQCCVRFCKFLVSAGIDSFASLVPETVKQFNLTDSHQTAEAKNAYNSRIRKFLIHLELKKKVAEGLHFALCSHAANRERIVEILDDDDRRRIHLYCANASTPIELRDAAILRIGMEMGFRASDIASLRLSDIDWKARFIRIIQEKTRVEHHHPMDTGTGNAIFRYLRDGRPQNSSTDRVFISVKAPYGPISLSSCRGALERAGTSTRKLHQIRKTYGTDTLRGGATISETAELLGHTGTNTVHKYISLDDKRMLLCPLSLAETGLALEGRLGYGE